MKPIDASVLCTESVVAKIKLYVPNNNIDLVPDRFLDLFLKFFPSFCQYDFDLIHDRQ